MESKMSHVCLDIALVKKGTEGGNDKVEKAKLVITETSDEKEICLAISGIEPSIRIDPWELSRAIRFFGYIPSGE